MDITEANKIFRKSIIKGFFEETLLTLDFKKSNVKHPNISGDGLMQSLLLQKAARSKVFSAPMIFL